MTFCHLASQMFRFIKWIVLAQVQYSYRDIFNPFSEQALVFVTNISSFVYFRLFIVTTGCPSERRPQKTVSCYEG